SPRRLSMHPLVREPGVTALHRVAQPDKCPPDAERVPGPLGLVDHEPNTSLPAPAGARPSLPGRRSRLARRIPTRPARRWRQCVVAEDGISSTPPLEEEWARGRGGVVAGIMLVHTAWGISSTCLAGEAPRCHRPRRSTPPASWRPRPPSSARSYEPWRIAAST